jgi:hypothetical protein
MVQMLRNTKQQARDSSVATTFVQECVYGPNDQRLILVAQLEYIG